MVTLPQSTSSRPGGLARLLEQGSYPYVYRPQSTRVNKIFGVVAAIGIIMIDFVL